MMRGMSLRLRLALAVSLALLAGAALSACGGSDDLVTASDADGDRVADVDDNCPSDANPAQYDTDADGFGDACDCDRQPLVCLQESLASGGCLDGIDNDGDGRADNADPNCHVEATANGNCGDAIDNDGDRLLDCAESTCAGAPGCPGGP